MDLIVRNPSLSCSENRRELLNNALSFMRNSLTKPLYRSSPAAFYYIPTETPFYRVEDKDEILSSTQKFLDSPYIVDLRTTEIHNKAFSEQREQFVSSVQNIRHLINAISPEEFLLQKNDFHFLYDQEQTKYIMSPMAYQEYMREIIARGHALAPSIRFYNPTHCQDYVILFQSHITADSFLSFEDIQWRIRTLSSRGYRSVDTSEYKIFSVEGKFPFLNYYSMGYHNAIAFVKPR